MFKKLVVLCLAAMPFAAWAQSSVKLAHLDVNLLFTQLPEAAQIDSTMKKTSAEFEQELQRMQEEYTRKATEFQQNEQTMDENIKKNRLEEIRMLETRLQNYYKNAQELLKTKQENLSTPVRDKIRQAIDAVAKENGFLYVFDAATILYQGTNAVDITNLVLKKMGVNPPAAAPAAKK